MLINVFLQKTSPYLQLYNFLFKNPFTLCGHLTDTGFIYLFENTRFQRQGINMDLVPPLLA